MSVDNDSLKRRKPHKIDVSGNQWQQLNLMQLALIDVKIIALKQTKLPPEILIST